MYRMKMLCLCTVSLLCIRCSYAQDTLLNEPLRSGLLPAGWTQTGVEFSTSSGGYARFTSLNAVLVTPVLDLSSYVQVELSFFVAKYGVGGDGPVTIEVSDDGGASWNVQTFDSPIPSGGTYLKSGPTRIMASGNNVRIRLSRSGSSSQKRVRDILLTGFNLSEANDPITYEFNGSWSIDPSGVASPFDSIIVKEPGAVISGDTYCRTLTMVPGSTLDMGSHRLSVSDTAVLMADSTGYAQLVGEVSGVARIQSYLNSLSPRFFNLSFPVSADLADVSFSNSTGFVANGTNSSNVYYYDAAAEDGQSLQGTWTAVSGLDQQADGRGYAVYMGSPHFGELPVTVSATGTLLNGSQTVDADFLISSSGQQSDNGWNYIPNPYPSSISWTALKALNPNLDATYYIDNGDGTFAAHNGITVVHGSAGPGSHSAPATNFIAPMQAFFVKLSGEGDLTFNNTIRSLSEYPIKYKSGIDFIKIKVRDSLSGASDEVAVGFAPGLTDDKDREFDGFKIANGNKAVPNLYIHSQGKKFAFHGISSDFVETEMQLNFESGSTGSYVLSSELDHVDSTWQILLKDKKTGEVTDLRRGYYKFLHERGEATDRFHLYMAKPFTGTEKPSRGEIFACIRNGTLVVRTAFRGNYQLCLYDLNGRLMMHEEMDGTYRSVELYSLSSGIYILKVRSRTGDEIHSQKVFY